MIEYLGSIFCLVLFIYFQTFKALNFDVYHILRHNKT